MPDYQNSKIYKLTCDDPELIYYGATTQRYLSNRLQGHIADWKKGNSVRSSLLFEAGNVKIQLIENCPCHSIDELNAIERRYIRENLCVNKIHPGRSSKKERWAEDPVSLKKEMDRRRARIKCPVCGLELNKVCLKRHIKRKHTN